MPTEVLPSQPGAGPTAPAAQPAAATAGTTTNTSSNADEIWKQNVWTKADGSVEDVIELEEEPRHHVSFVNDFTKIITIQMSPNDTTLAHRHQADTIIIICMEGGVDFINDVMGCGPPQVGRMEFGQVGFAPYSEKPCVHKITNLSPVPFFVVNIEVLAKAGQGQLPMTSTESDMQLQHHTLVKEQSNCRIYKLSLEPGQSTTVTYAFFYVRVVLRGGQGIHNALAAASTNKAAVQWTENLSMGDAQWLEPCVERTITNQGDSLYEAYICEFL